MPCSHPLTCRSHLPITPARFIHVADCAPSSHPSRVLSDPLCRLRLRLHGAPRAEDARRPRASPRRRSLPSPPRLRAVDSQVDLDLDLRAVDSQVDLDLDMRYDEMR